MNINNKFPYLSIIIPVYNMKKYIERSVLSILNQTFRDFEIIIINDYSNDNTKDLINKLEKYANNIKVIEHKKNLGVYSTRVDGIFLAKGKYILFIDPDDSILNPLLFRKIYDFNNEYNLDIIEFVVYYEKEGRLNIFLPKEHRFNHFHNFTEKIIYQPKLSNLLFFEPGKENYSDIICRPVWNKIIKKEILLKSINFIGKDIYKNKYFNYAEDTIINILNFEFAKNYSNINLPGYLYNIRKKSISHGKLGINHDMMIYTNFFLYLKLFYKYIHYFNKDRNYLFYEIKAFKNFIIKLKNFNNTEIVLDLEHFCNRLLIDKNISNEFKHYLLNIKNN